MLFPLLNDANYNQFSIQGKQNMMWHSLMINPEERKVRNGPQEMRY